MAQRRVKKEEREADFLEVVKRWGDLLKIAGWLPEIIKGVGEMNHLQVIFHGEQIDVLCNGVLAATMEDVENVAGLIGLYNCTCGGEGQARAYFDNLLITAP